MNGVYPFKSFCLRKPGGRRNMKVVQIYSFLVWKMYMMTCCDVQIYPLLAPLEGEIWVPHNIQCWYGKMWLKNLKIGPFYDDCIYEKTVDRPSVPFLFLNKIRYPTSTDVWKNKIKRCIFSE